MSLRSVISLLLAVVLLAGACTSDTTTSPTPAAPQSSGTTGRTLPPSASGVVPSTGQPVTPAPGSPGPNASGTPAPSPTGTGPSPTPRPPKPLPAYISHGPRKGSQKILALTFDADMYPFMYSGRNSTNRYDPRVIQLIEDNHLHATIFANGLYVQAFPDLIKELSKQPGIEIGNHTWDHAAWTSSCNDPLAPTLTNKNAEIKKVQDIVKQTVGYAPEWFRFPGGCYGGGDLNLVKSYGAWPVGWDCYFGDTLGWSAAKQIASVENNCRNGSIVITHLNNARYHPNIYEALKVLIPWWKKNGWTIVNITELMGQSPPKP